MGRAMMVRKNEFSPETSPSENPDRKDVDSHDDARVEKLGGRNGFTDGIDPVLDIRLTRKFDKHMLPWLFGIWLCAFIDRSNIGNAKIDGLDTDLKLTSTKFNTALVVFYVPYILVDVCACQSLLQSMLIRS